MLSWAEIMIKAAYSLAQNYDIEQRFRRGWVPGAGSRLGGLLSGVCK